MSSTTQINIKNKLEILPGSVIRLPGCEPISSFSSLALAANIHCKASQITLEDALKAIPDAKIVRVLSPIGVPGTGKFLELPNGPSPDGNNCDCPRIMEDWYQILKDNATPVDFNAIEDEEPLGNCEASANWTGCLSDQDQFHKAPDLTLRPNVQPLAGA